MLRIVFMGTPAFAVPTLSAILAAGHEVAAVYTQPPRPAGRGLAERKSPVHALAEQHGIAVLTPARLKGEDVTRAFAGHGADVCVVVAYGLLLPLPVLRAPRAGCLNLHASALPRWRGAAPIQRAIIAGDTVTAASVMRMQQGLDTGPVCAAQAIAIGPDMTAGKLHDQIAERGAHLMVAALAALAAGTLTCLPQATDGVTYAAKITTAETRIDFAAPARQVHDQIRGLSPAPAAWFAIDGNGGPERIKVLRSELCVGAALDTTQASVMAGTVLDHALTVACGEGAVRILQVQRAGKRPLPAADFLRGFALPPGTVLRGPR